MCFRPAEVQLNKCPQCGKVNKPIDKTCVACGTELTSVPTTVVCPLCGVTNPTTAQACANCGATESEIMAAMDKAPGAPRAPVAPTAPGAPKPPTPGLSKPPSAPGAPPRQV